MHWYHAILLVGALVAAWLAWRVPRAPVWIAAGASSFFVTSLWHDFGLPQAAAFGAATNLVICYAMYAYARLRYELRVWNCFHLMILLDLLYMGGIIKTHYAFAVSLELANWLALVIIGATGITERLRDGSRDVSWRGSWAGSLNRALLSNRKRPPFWQTP